MGAPRLDTIQWGQERARAGPWRGDRAVAYLSPVADAPAPSAAFVRRCLADLAARGYRRVVTGALSPAESNGFLAAGFEITERLHLLAHDLAELPPEPEANLRLRRARTRERGAILALDHVAFRPFWRLDSAGLDEALSATPHARFRVAETGGAPAIVGYAIFGRAGRRGYLQRLAVDPDLQRNGIATALVVDGLRWLQRWKADRVVVNTQLDNEPALRLYERLGFRRQPLGLTVLSAGLEE